MMKRILFIAILLVTSSVSVANQAVDSSLSNKIDRLLKNFGDTVSIGIEVKDQKTGRILYNKNADHYFMPASNEKLFTASAALESLNENFTYKTQLFVDVSKIKNGILNGNIYIQFSGDPSLTFMQLDHLISSLSTASIHQINGNIIIDDSAFDQMAMSPGSTWDDKDFCWGAPVNAISIEHNCVKATIVPATNPDTKSSILLPDYPQSLQFINNTITRASTVTDCAIEIKRTSTTNYTINGCIATSTKPKNIEMAIDNPRLNIQFLVVYLLNKNHILNSQYVEFKKIEILPKLLASENSPPLSILVTTMLKESDNIIANSLFKTMGALYSKDVGSFQNGSDAVRYIINKSIQLDIPNTTLVDGSGGSRYDFLTPQQIVILLQKMYSSNHAFIFVHALPISGIDGTLKNRMKDPDTLGKVYAKTGTATAVSTLSGYLETQKKHKLIFSIMINGFVDSPNKYQDLEDEICVILVENA
jgi:D-alanyl-D-alanine carboxypeptidase/D-alanyl-D-alanine-endopeptidase (penicillin-binding protein 4)